MTAHEELLRRFKPQLRYDSNEAFFADSAALWTDNPANSLRRKPEHDRPGTLLAAASSAADEPRLSLDFLAPSRYPSGAGVEATDAVDCSRHDYRDQYVALRRRDPETYANRMYGRAKEDRGRLWLQYWFFYFYNDYNLAGGIGLHEGDWEMVQLRMAEDGDRPDLAVYAQHRWAEVSAWDEVEKVAGRPDTPVVYVARGSHASYFRAGYHETEAWYDLADGKRTTPDLQLVSIGDGEPGWTAWPGIWGGTRAQVSGVDQPSPEAPCCHAQWDHPASLVDRAVTAKRGTATPPPPVKVTRDGDHLQLAYDFRRQPSPRHEWLVVTVNSEDDDVQPRTFTFVVDTAPVGTISTSVELEPAQNYDIYVSAVDADGKPTESELTLIRPLGAEEPHPIWPLTLFGRIVSWFRGLFNSE